MKKSFQDLYKKIRAAIFCFFTFFILITLVAWLVRSSTLMCIIGLVLFVITMFPIIIGSALKKLGLFILNTFDQKEQIRLIIQSSFLVKLAKKFPEVFRSVIQTVGFWIVKVYSELSTFEFDFEQLVSIENFIFPILLIATGSLGEFLKNENQREKFAWISNVAGNVSFLRGLFLLYVGAFLNSYFYDYSEFFSSFIWFLDNSLSSRIIFNLGIDSFLMGLVCILFIIMSIGAIRNYELSERKREFAWGILIFLTWIFTIPLYTIYKLFLYKTKRELFAPFFVYTDYIFINYFTNSILFVSVNPFVVSV